MASDLQISRSLVPPPNRPRPDEAMAWIEPKERPFQPSPATIRAMAGDAEDHFKSQLPPDSSHCRVGIICDDEQAFQGPSDYIRYFVGAVLDSGGEPRLLFPCRADVSSQMQGIDALLIPGGADVHPKFYGQPVGPNMRESGTYPEDDEFALNCIRTAYADEMPMLGICRGLQLMNVAGGGTLIQDIPKEFNSPFGLKVDHRPAASQQQPERTIVRAMPAHDMHILDAQSQLAQLLQTACIGINSIHHQAIGLVAPLLSVTAIAPDGIIEAAERRGVPCQMGIQGHPELIRRVDKRFQALFDYLVTNGSRYSTQRTVHTPAAEPPH